MTQSLPVGPGGIAPPPPQIEREREGGERGGGERGGKRSVVLVFFIGGVTFSEIAALRLLSQKRVLFFLFFCFFVLFLFCFFFVSFLFLF